MVFTRAHFTGLFTRVQITGESAYFPYHIYNVSNPFGVTEYREYPELDSARIYTNNSRLRVPFFFEPNFDATVEPLSAALRIQEEDRRVRKVTEPLKMYSPVVYGEFLLRKVSGNFRYDAD